MTHVAAQARVPTKALVVFLIVAALLLTLGALTVVRGMVLESRTVQVVNVVDGNTVVVNRDGEERTLTMAGMRSAIRNPEGYRVGPEFCMGEEAYVWLRDRLPQGATVRIDTSDEGAPEGQEAAVFEIGGDKVNVAMAEAGMAAPTGLGVDGETEEEIAEANLVAQTAGSRDNGVGLYDRDEQCSMGYQLFEATTALEQTPTTPKAETVAEIDATSVAYADAVDSVRLVQQRIQGLDPARGTFTDLAYAPAKEKLLATADPVVQQGLGVLQDLNARRNALAAR